MAFWFISSVNYQITFFFYIQEGIENPCLFFYLYLSICFFLVFICFSSKSKKKKIILIFLTPFLNEDFYSVILIVIIDKPEFISAILFQAF